jgi:hypothetical protein
LRPGARLTRLRAFIVRPFGTQQGVDFDRMQRELIEPALARLRQLGTPIDGGTTGLISKAGNIREDMFRLLAVSDLVIADVTIHNANAFYELGVRHALRAGCTQLIRARGSEFRYPFDLQTDRYFEYDLNDLAGNVEALAQGIRATLAERRDSPVFLMLENLKPHARGDLVRVPDDFREEVEIARKAGHRGDLRLLAHECVSFEWDQEGLKMVGDAQFKLRAYSGAKDTFELLLVAARDDYHANWRLGSIFQRLASAATGAQRETLTTQSEQAIDRALRVANAAQKAELNGLLGSNAKNRWMEDYRGEPEGQRAPRALESPCLDRMLQCYLRAAAFDLDEHYPAINALAFLKVQIQLARLFSDRWAALQETDPEGELKRREQLAERIAATLRLSLRLDNVFKAFQTPADPWSASSVADLSLLSDPTRTQVITNRYREANTGADRFSLEANRRNLDIFKELGLFEPGVTAALEVIDEEIRRRAPPERQLKRALLFTGHMVDAVGRAPEKARFPRTSTAEATARQLIHDAVKKEVGADASDTLGIAGGASGGDILFHEVCAELGIETELYLALPVADFQTESVEPGGEDWVARFQAQCRKKPPRILQKSLAPPEWLASLEGYNIWERNNLWMMFGALATGAARQTLIALFNEDRDPDGPGGTRHLLTVARKHGLRTLPLDARPLLK